MNTKEAIKWVRDNIINAYYPKSPKKVIETANDIVTLLQRGEKFEKMWGEAAFNHLTLEEFYNIKRKYFPELCPCSYIKQLEQFKNEFVKSEHSYYMERFMETCIRLFKRKEN